MASIPGQDNPIHMAMKRGFFQQVRFHVDQGHDVNCRDERGRTPLILCSSVADEKWAIGLARLFIENGARISKCDKQGFNALHHACINQKEKLVDVYLSALDCDVHTRCHKGNTSLHYAALLGNRLIVKALAQLLVKYKLNLDPKNRKGFTPLHHAFKSDHVECGDLLVDYGADVKIPDPDDVTKTALDLRSDAIERIEKMATKKQSSRVKRNLKVTKLERPKTTETIMLYPAKDFDLRNDPEYVFNTSAVDYFLHKDYKDIMKRPKTASMGNKIWRDEINRLWFFYEIQYTKSYRKPAKEDDPSVSKSRSDSVTSGSGHSVPPLHRRSSRMSIKSRAGSISSTYDSSSRRPSTQSRRMGMPPLVRTQSRASFNLS